MSVSDIEIEGEDVLQKFPVNKVLSNCKSICWEFFHFKGDETSGPEKSNIYCNYCDKKYVYMSTTTSFKAHVESKHSAEYKQVVTEKGLKSEGSKLMFKYFSIPATSTEAERVFSALGNLLTKKRLSMTGDDVDKQLFLRDKFRKSQ